LVKSLPHHPSWYGFVEQELHLNIGKEPTGFDQHRLYTGIGKKFSAYCTVEGGYQWIYANTSASNNEQNIHMALIQVLLQTPTVFKKASTSTGSNTLFQPEERKPQPTEPHLESLPTVSPLNDY
jgi:hypothetical protein